MVYDLYTLVIKASHQTASFGHIMLMQCFNFLGSFVGLFTV